MQEDSFNVADDGNFSVQVITAALSGWGITCIPISQVQEAQANPVSVFNFCLFQQAFRTENAFVCNLGSHWFTIRKIDGFWFNLNSLLKTPQYLGDFYLRFEYKQIFTHL